MAHLVQAAVWLSLITHLDVYKRQSWKNAPDGKIVKAAVYVAKNYLSMDEMQELNEIVTMYLDYATRQARRHIPMTIDVYKRQAVLPSECVLRGAPLRWAACPG